MSAPASRALSIVVTTYQWPEALDLVLQALSEQTSSSFEVVVADDGSGPATAALLERWAPTFEGRLRHAWHADEGYRRARVLNLGASTATGECLIFLDGDCIPRREFVASIDRGLLDGWFLAGKRLLLSRDFSRRVLEDRVPVWRWSPLGWLARAPREVRRPGLLLPLRDRRRPWRANQPEFRPPYNAYGSLLVVTRAAFERVNGFDARYVGWGHEDADIAVRLRRAGVRCGWAGPRTTLIHLWHESRKDMVSNAPLLRESREGDRIEALDGLRELESDAEPNAPRVEAS